MMFICSVMESLGSSSLYRGILASRGGFLFLPMNVRRKIVVDNACFIVLL
jgi:hypothetical protein